MAGRVAAIVPVATYLWASALVESFCRSGNIRQDAPELTRLRFLPRGSSQFRNTEGFMALPTDLTVFVVDDESVIALTLATILKQSGFIAKAFTNPAEALNSAGSEAPDLLVSDVMMPEMLGVDLAIQLKAIRPACKVLLFSGQAATAEYSDFISVVFSGVKALCHFP
jgi:CheY-like chemotaxis protein